MSVHPVCLQMILQSARRQKGIVETIKQSCHAARGRLITQSRKMIKLLRYVIWLPFLIAGCGDVQVYDVDTKIAHTIQVEPISNSRKTVYIRIKDVTGHASELATMIENQLKTEGYKVIAEPDLATFKLMVNVIKFGVGTSNDEITYLQGVDPAAAAALAAEQVKSKNIRRNTNVYSKEKPNFFNSPYGKRKDDIYVEDSVVEETYIRYFADRVGIADVEIVNSRTGKAQKTRIMAGVNVRGGLFKSATPQVDQFGWVRLLQRLSFAVGTMF